MQSVNVVRRTNLWIRLNLRLVIRLVDLDLLVHLLLQVVEEVRREELEVEDQAEGLENQTKELELEELENKRVLKI